MTVMNIYMRRNGLKMLSKTHANTQPPEKYIYKKVNEVLLFSDDVLGCKKFEVTSISYLCTFTHLSPLSNSPLYLLPFLYPPLLLFYPLLSSPSSLLSPLTFQFHIPSIPGPLLSSFFPPSSFLIISSSFLLSFFICFTLKIGINAQLCNHQYINYSKHCH